MKSEIYFRKFHERGLAVTAMLNETPACPGSVGSRGSPLPCPPAPRPGPDGQVTRLLAVLSEAEDTRVLQEQKKASYAVFLRFATGPSQPGFLSAPSSVVREAGAVCSGGTRSSPALRSRPVDSWF